MFTNCAFLPCFQVSSLEAYQAFFAEQQLQQQQHLHQLQQQHLRLQEAERRCTM